MILGMTYELVGVLIGVGGVVVGSVLSVVLYRLGTAVRFGARMEQRGAYRQAVREMLRGRADLPEVHLINTRRYERDYDGEWGANWRGELVRKAELLDVRHNGVEFVIEVVNTWLDDSGQRTLTPTEQQSSNALKIGLIPYDFIQFVDSDGNEFSGAPLFYVKFQGPGQSPFAYSTYAEATPGFVGPSGRPYYRRIDSLGRTEVGRIRGLIGFWAFLARQRRFEKQMLKARESAEGSL